MKNKIIKSSVLAFALSGLFLLHTSCENTDVEDTVIDANQPILTITSSTGSFNIEEEEGDQVITLTATLSKPTDKQVRAYIFFDSTSEADNGDIMLPGTGNITIPPFQTSATATMTIVRDNTVEGTELAVINIGDSRTTAAEFTPFKMEIKINNFATDETRMLLEWDDDSLDDHLCDMDFDVYLDTFDAYAFTSDCPEDLFEPVNPSNLWTSVLADGSYEIFVDLWDSNGFNPSPAIAVPLRLAVGKRGKFEAYLDLGNLYTSESNDSNNDGDGVMSVGSIEVVNGLFNVYDRSGNLVAAESE